MLEAIRAATAEKATAEEKAAGVQACRTILTALEAEAGKPLAPPGAPAPSALAGIDPGQALDVLIARLRAALPSDKPAPAKSKPGPAGLRIALVTPPVGSTRRRR
ncbi:MAG TPA: hypothetical protein VKB80_07835 [Kofleriaceae bacterium]|nr:hypothetical protein [Kofleriaceae bacterium]